MSEQQSRPARGRSTARGGARGAPGSRGPRSSKQTNGDQSASSLDADVDQGELGELKRRYQSQLPMLRELFPDWTDVDLVLAMEENDGDMQATVEKISEGNVSQFAEVKKNKDRSRSKAKPDTTTHTEPASAIRGARGGLGERRGTDSGRGGRGRGGTDRGRGGFRGGARGGAAIGARPSGASVPTTESSAWDTPTPLPELKETKENDTKESSDGWAATAEQVAAPVVGVLKEAAAAVSAPKKTWASMFAAPKPAPTPSKPAEKPAAAQEESKPDSSEQPAHEVAQEKAVESEELPIPPVADEVETPQAVDETPSVSTPEKAEDTKSVEQQLTPSRDELTKDNVEHLPDDSEPAPTETAASTVASQRDIGTLSAVATPLSTGGQMPIGRPAAGGYATSALKATTGIHPRSVSFQRRLAEQQEAVVMPGNHAVDRAAVQFGSLGLNGEVDADSLDVDEDREEAETRPQPPQHSPVQPRASLPPAPRQAESQAQEPVPAPKGAPGLPQPQHQQSPPTSLGTQPAQTPGSQANQSYNQFGRYNQAGQQSEASAPQQKQYDPFGQQTPQTNQYDYNSHQSQQPYSQAGGFSSGPDSFASQYSTADQQRSGYYYNQNYNQQQTPSQQEAGSAQQRTGSAFGSAPTDSSFPASQQQQGLNRYNDTNSGHTTPNPALGGQHPTGPASQAQHMHHPHAQGGHSAGYQQYNHPYYNNPYYANYMNQFGSYGQGGYGGFGGKQSMYPQQPYGMSPQNSFEQHSSSPAQAGSFGRESSLAGGLGDYGRTASSASHTQQGATAGSFGNLPDVFSGRTQGYPNQSSSYGQQGAGQQGGNEDALKPYGDAKSTGPSPSALGAQPGRPGSATQNTPSQAGPQQSHQQGFGGYPGHLQGGQNSQYGGLGGLGHQGAGNHQAGGYGSNYGGFGQQQYGSYNRGAGWGASYGQH